MFEIHSSHALFLQCWKTKRHKRIKFHCQIYYHQDVEPEGPQKFPQDPKKIVLSDDFLLQSC